MSIENYKTIDNCINLLYDKIYNNKCFIRINIINLSTDINIVIWLWIIITQEVIGQNTNFIKVLILL